MVTYQSHINPMDKISEVFEGPNSSLKAAFDTAASFDFDLPEVASNAPTAPRVHIGGSVCVGCEG